MATFDELIAQGYTVDSAASAPIPAMPSTAPTFDDFIAQGYTVDATPAPTQEGQSYWEAVAGGATDLANALTFNHGDEIVAGGSAVTDRIFRGTPLGEAYDSRLDQVRGLRKDYRTQNPTTAFVTDIVGAIKNPVSAIGAPIKGAGLLMNMGRAAGAGALQGGLYGFGEGEGGFENRASDALQSGAISGVLSGGISGVTQGLAPTIKKLGQASDRKSLGTVQSDYAKTIKAYNPMKGYDPKTDLDPLEFVEGSDVKNLTTKVLNELTETNALGKNRDPQTMLDLARLKSADLAAQVDNEIASVKTKVTPRFDQTLEFLNKGGVAANEVNRYTRLVNNLSKEIQERGKGSLKYLQEQKKVAGDKYKLGKTAGDKFYRTLYHDLQANIERYAPKVKELNKEIQKYMIATPILERNMARSDASNIGSWFVDSLRTSGGKLTTPVLIAGNAGLGALAGPVGLGAGLALSAATTPTGQMWTGKALRGAANTFQSGAIPSIIGQQVGGPENEERQIPALNLVEPGDIPPFYQDPLQQLAQQPAGQPAELYINQAQTPEPDPFAAMAETTPIQPQPTGDQPMAQKEPVSQIVESLVDSVITQESAGKVNAVSKKGAQGLMQLMPATGRELAAKVGVKYDPFDPEQNVYLGKLYLNQMLQEFNGDLELALTAYNQGPNRVKKLLAQTGGSTLDDIIDKLGPDGKKYAKQILARYQNNQAKEV